MDSIKNSIESRMNCLGKKREPFAFLIDFEFQHPKIFKLKESQDELLWQIPCHSNFTKETANRECIQWDVNPVSFCHYSEAFDLVQQHIHSGNTYLLNLTFPSEIATNLELEDIFLQSKALYKIYLKNHFVCFSPETFIRIDYGKISSYPMKGTIDAAISNAEIILKNDIKELAEHNTIVDLIRNDLSLVAENVVVEKFRYIDRIETNQGILLQMSSKITGQLPDNYHEQIGTIVLKLLPAGSISGAPKKKTIEIIQEAEKYTRGYYTGVFGIFDGYKLDSCVLIRYIEKKDGKLTFKSGGGITFMSNCKSEYEELIRKVYVPIAGDYKN